MKGRGDDKERVLGKITEVLPSFVSPKLESASSSGGGDLGEGVEAEDGNTSGRDEGGSRRSRAYCGRTFVGSRGLGVWIVVVEREDRS